MTFAAIAGCRSSFAHWSAVGLLRSQMTARAQRIFFKRVGDIGVTHISGTPSHWRRALMSSAAGRIAPRYVRLSGEIADQAILNRPRNVYPNAAIVHAFASTELAWHLRSATA